MEGKTAGASKARQSAPSHPGIALCALTKRFAGTTAVDKVTVDIAAGEFFVVLGPSGCGKSTLLRAIAGLENVDGGTIHLGPRHVAGEGAAVPPEDRGVAVVFQSYALWPHMSVRKNVGFPTQAAGLAKPEATAIVDRALDAVALTPLAERKPAALSGGQQQRVALARCLASRADVVLMDEPLANLDPHLRGAMETELMRVHKASGATTLYITHDQREAMALADRIAVMRNGRFEQVAAPQILYDRPATEAVARFIGRAAIVPVEVLAAHAGTAQVRLAGHAIEVAAPTDQAPGPAQLVVRPGDLAPTSDGPLQGEITSAVYRGGVYEHDLDFAGAALVLDSPHRLPSGPTRFALSSGWVLPA